MSASDSSPPARKADAEWATRPERSTRGTLRLMTWLSLKLGRRAGRLLLAPIALYFVLFAPAARRASQQWLTRALARRPGFGDVWRHFHTFASTIHDRIYLINDRHDLFDIRVQGGEPLRAAAARGEGVLLIGAHLGSFEVLRALGRSGLGARVAMVMYADNARKVNEALAAINPAAMQDIIPLGQLDSMLQVGARLDEGVFVGLLADRGLGNDARTTLDFLGSPAEFPLGPWRMAAMLKRPVYLMAGLYLGGNRYEIHFAPLADFSAATRDNRARLQEEAVIAYARELEALARRAPYNWFNFFDFWRDTASRRPS